MANDWVDRMNAVEEPLAEIALSSVDGKSWWDSSVPFPFPDAPDPRVKRFTLGRLDANRAIELDAETLRGLKNLSDYFPQLEHLHLWGLTNLEKVDELPDTLKSLDVRKCPALKSIGEIPEKAKLESLDLGDCPIVRRLPDGPLESLQYAWLNGCKGLSSIDGLLPAMDGLRHLELHGCRLRELDSALCGEAGENVLEKVRTHLREKVNQGADALAECKLIVLGNGGVGKTEWVRALKGKPFDDSQASTDGIRLWKWDGDGHRPFPGVNELTVNIWDFGGQDLYHNTHRMFLENRAVFVVIEREENEDGSPFRPNHPNDPNRPLDYWLDQIYATNPEARVLVVRSQSDITEGVKTLGPLQGRVRDEYAELDYFELSSATEYRDSEVWQQLRQRLLEFVDEELRSLESVMIPRGRVAVRKELQKWQPASDGEEPCEDGIRPMLRWPEYQELVRETYAEMELSEPNDDELKYSLDYFHHSGALYAPPKWQASFQTANPPQESAFPIIVDQRWVIEGIYQLLVQGKGREQLLAQHGHISLLHLEQLWGEVLSPSGEPRYGEEARWAMRKFMQSCGLLVQTSSPGEQERYLMPEFLPTLGWFQDMQATDPVIAKTLDSPKARTYRIRDRRMGQGFGCLLVGELVRQFGKRYLFRYGAFIPMGLRRYQQIVEELTIALQWARQNEDDFQGDLELTIHGVDSHDPEILSFFLERFKSLPDWPAQTRWERTDASAVQTSGATAFSPPSTPDLPLRPGEDLSAEQARAEQQEKILHIPIFASVGISAAGEDKEHPGIEKLPKAIERGLQDLKERGISVLYYKTDEQITTVSKLILELSESDLMVAVISEKYLRSEYCMSELLQAARHASGTCPEGKSKDAWAGNQDEWLHRVWPVPMPEVEGYLTRSSPEQSEDKLDALLKYWANKAGDYVAWRATHGGLESEPENQGIHDWMMFVAHNPQNIKKLLSAASDFRLTHVDWNGNTDDADAMVGSLVERISERMLAKVAGLSPAERSELLRKQAESHWKAERRTEASECLIASLEQHPEKEQLLNDPQAELPEEFQPLRAVFEHHRTRNV